MKKNVNYICVLGILVVSICGIFLYNSKDDKHPIKLIVSEGKITGDNNVSEKDNDEQSLSCYDYFVKKMSTIDFNAELIEKIFDCNEIVFESWYEYNRPMLDHQIVVFASLKGYDDIQSSLLNSPDVATIVASVASKYNGIESAKNILISVQEASDDANIIRSLYGFYATPDDAIHLTNLLRNGSNQKYIIELYKQGQGDLSFLKFFEILEENRIKAPHAAEVYQKWLYTLLDEMLAMDPESDEADDNYLLLISQSEPLMKTLKSNEDVCNYFFEKYWNDYSAILKSVSSGDEFRDARFLSYISNDALWEFLIAYPESGVDLVKKYGDFAPFFLMHPEFLNNPKAKDRITTLMLNANDEQAQAIQQIPEDSLFLYSKFLQRALDDSIMMKGIIALANAECLQSSSCAKKKLEYWQNLSDDALLRDDDFAPDTVTFVSFLPGYDIGVIIYKSIDGREITATDFTMAGIDTVFLGMDALAIITAIPTGGGSVVAVESTKTAAKSATKAVAKGTAKAAASETVKGAVKNGIKIGVKSAAKQAIKESSKSTLKRVMLAGVKSSRQVARKEFLSMVKGYASKLSKVNITSKVQSVFKALPVKNATFKKLTGLDARIFMRSDRRVYFDLKNAITKTIGNNITKSIADDVLWGAAGYMILSTPEGQKALEKMKNTIDKSVRQKSEEEIWKSNLSAWWMLNQNDDIINDDKFDQAITVDKDVLSESANTDNASDEIEEALQ